MLLHTLLLSAGLGAWEYSAHIFFGVLPNLYLVLLFSFLVFLIYHLDHFRDLIKLKNNGIKFHATWKPIYFIGVVLLICGIGYLLLIEIPQKCSIHLMHKNMLWLLPSGIFTLGYFFIAIRSAFYLPWIKEWLIALAVTCAVYGIPLATSTVEIQPSLCYPLIGGWAICISNIICINVYELKYDRISGFYNGLLNVKNPEKYSRKTALISVITCVLLYIISILFSTQNMSIIFVVIAIHLYVTSLGYSYLQRQLQYRLAIDGCFLWFLLRVFL